MYALTMTQSAALGAGTRQAGDILALLELPDDVRRGDLFAAALYARTLADLPGDVELLGDAKTVEVLTALRNPQACRLDEFEPEPSQPAASDEELDEEEFLDEEINDDDEGEEGDAPDDDRLARLRALPIDHLREHGLEQATIDRFVLAQLATCGAVIDFGDAHQGLKTIRGIGKQGEARTKAALEAALQTM